MSHRRVIVSNNVDGTSTVQIDGAPPRSHEMASLPGFVNTLLWKTPASPAVGNGAVEDATPSAVMIPAPGETQLMIVSFPPDSSMGHPDFDPMAFGAESLEAMPGLAEKFEPDNPGMHTTDSIDYDVVLEGEIVLELDDGQTVELSKHDVVVQHGTRHAWRNPTDKPTTMLFVLVGASRSS